MPIDRLYPVVLLLGSNLFMTFAWYGHLKHKSAPLTAVIIVSWGIAFVEYCLAVPANRMGAAHYSTAELKTIQEVVTLLVFVAFSWLYLREPLGWNHIVGFALIALGAAVVFLAKAQRSSSPGTAPARGSFRSKPHAKERTYGESDQACR